MSEAVCPAGEVEIADKMLTTLLVSKEDSSFKGFVSGLRQRGDNEVLSTSSCNKALQIIKERPVDMVIVDEELSDMSGLQFVRKLVTVNPLINCAVVSSLSAEDFHEESEGLGVFMQLPLKPREKDAEVLMRKFSKIADLMNL